VSTLLYATVYMFLHNLMNVLVQIAKNGIQKKNKLMLNSIKKHPFTYLLATTATQIEEKKEQNLNEQLLIEDGKNRTSLPKRTYSSKYVPCHYPTLLLHNKQITLHILTFLGRCT
jgi:hypothetical protein